MTRLETAVDRLHAVPLEDFVAERKRLAKDLRGAGDREAAAELAKLPKPSAPAWALNNVARAQPELLGEWLDSAESLRDASTHADRASGDALRAAMAGHRDVTRRLLATVREAARPNGRELSEPMLDRARDLLQAATADPARAELLRAGRAVEGDDEAQPLPQPAAGKRGGAKSSKGAAPGRRAGAKPSKAAATDREGRAEQQREAKARAELERLVAAAEQRLAELHEAAEERAAAAAQAGERLEEARRTLHRSESEAAAAHQAAGEAAEVVAQGERELRTLNAKLSS